MESFNPNREIGDIKGSEIYTKIKEVLLSKHRAKKKFFQVPSIENNALLEMTSFLFIKILSKTAVEGEREFHTKSSSELYNQTFNLNMTWNDFEKKIWAEVGQINEYEAITKYGLSKYAIELFEPKIQKIKNKYDEKPKPYTQQSTYSTTLNERWDKKKEREEEENEERLRKLKEKETNSDQE